MLYSKYSQFNCLTNIFKRTSIDYAQQMKYLVDEAYPELSVLNRQCLNRRISDKETLIQEVAAWEQKRNQSSSPVD